MNDQQHNIVLLDAVERYIAGDMTPDERLQFENLRKTNSDVDQMVVEHTLFLQKLNSFNQWQKFQTSLNEIHSSLSAKGALNEPNKQGKMRSLLVRFRKTAAIAASIAGVTALIVSGIIGSVTPKVPNSQLEILKGDIHTLAQKSRIQDREINNLKQSGVTNKTPEIPYTNSGTGFIIDGRGYLITNNHVVEKAQNIAVQNTAGKEFFAKVVYNNPVTDIAIIKIDDPDFKSMPGTPYSFTKRSTDLAEPIFTLGYPREEIVYGEGYLSSKTGYNGDTLSCQIDIRAERGNSGSPILNTNGEVIGILNAKQKDADGVAFAIQSRNIFNALTELKKQAGADSTLKTVRLNTKSLLGGLKGPQQVKKIEDYVYMVKVN